MTTRRPVQDLTCLPAAIDDVDVDTVTAAPAACSDASHAAIKGSALRFLRETDAIGIMPDGATGLLLANCRRCQSTLARPLPAASPGERLDAAKVCMGCGGRAEADAMCDACAAEVRP